MDNTLLILRYWGKAKPETNSGPQWHPLIYHSMDVAACGRKFLEADTERRQTLAQLSGLAEESLLAWLSFLLAIHGFDRRVGHFRPQDMADEIPKPPFLQGDRDFYLGRRLLGWPAP